MSLQAFNWWILLLKKCICPLAAGSKVLDETAQRSIQIAFFLGDFFLPAFDVSLTMTSFVSTSFVKQSEKSIFFKQRCSPAQDPWGHTEI
jgi:hypothetical protein